MKRDRAVACRQRTLITLTLALLLVGGCMARPTPLAEPKEHLLLAHTSPPDQLCRSLARAAASGDRDAAAQMFPLLEHEDAGVRFCAHQALVSLLGADPVSYRPHAPRAERAQLAQAWRDAVGIPAASANESR